MRYLLIGLISFLSYGLARDMVAGSEQFYVSQGLFANLNMQAVACGIVDDTTNFACGLYQGDQQSFEIGVEVYVRRDLPSLVLVRDWYVSGQSLVRVYQSRLGTYFLTFHTNGLIVLAFTPYT